MKSYILCKTDFRNEEIWDDFVKALYEKPDEIDQVTIYIPDNTNPYNAEEREITIIHRD